MKIITIMNYTSEPDITMCKAWIHFVKRFNPKAEVTVFYKNNIKSILSYSKRFSEINFKYLDTEGVPNQSNTIGYTWPSQDIKLAIWKNIETLNLYKFIYIDADAFVLGSLDNWWKIIDDKPFIAVNESIAEDGLPLFNAGVFSYSNNNHFISYKKLISQLKLDRNVIKIPIGDQGILNSYLRSINYDHTHKEISFEYNCIAKNCIIKSVGEEISIYSGYYPKWKIILKKLVFRKTNFWEKWLWWNIKRKVKILHAFGNRNFKFWNLPECKPLWEYCKKITS